MNKIEQWQLAQRQSLPLEQKILLAKRRIKEWYEHWQGQVYVAFSGGKDSTVLLHLVREMYPEVPAVFADTGLEFPEIREFVKTFDNVVWLKPKMSFKAVIEKYGYPVVGKEVSNKVRWYRNSKCEATRKRILSGERSENGKYVSGKLSNKWHYLIDSDILINDYCCDVMKKAPAKKYEKETGRRPIIGTMAGESRLRKRHYLLDGCNAYDNSRPTSKPFSVWLEKDIWEYIRGNNIPYSKIYDMGYERTGCMFCMFGIHLESSPNRFQLMAKTHPKQYDYCINKLGCGHAMDVIGVKYKPEPTLFELY